MAPKKKKAKAVKRAKKPAKKAVKKSKPKAKAKAAPKKAKPAAKAAVSAPARPGKVKKAKPRGAKQKDPILPWRSPLPGETFLGIVDDFYGKIGVITLNLVAPLKTGEK